MNGNNGNSRKIPNSGSRLQIIVNLLISWLVERSDNLVVRYFHFHFQFYLVLNLALILAISFGNFSLCFKRFGFDLYVRYWLRHSKSWYRE